jgi:hypothetical protein
MDDDVGDVAMDEQLARIEVDELVRGNAAVGAADPQVLRRLLLRAGEEAGRPASIFFAQRRCCRAGPAGLSRGVPWRGDRRRRQ